MADRAHRKQPFWMDTSQHLTASAVDDRVVDRKDYGETMIGTCGDNCQFCPRYVATKEERPEALEKVKELWVRLGLRDPDVPAQALVCYGCEPENPCAYSEFRTCTNERKVENCGLCHEYPCGLIMAAFDKSEKLYFHAIRVCTPAEMAALEKAFFMKRQTFDQIHREVKERE